MTAARRVSISDVAKHAGVSIGTVSNYLNYPDRVSSTLKEKIGSSIRVLGYVPRRPSPAMMQAMRSTSKTDASGTDVQVIGFVMTDIEHSLFTSIFEGAQEVCDDNGMQLIGMNAFSDTNRQSAAVNTLLQMNVAGILLSTVEDSSLDVAACISNGTPIVLVDHTAPTGIEVCSVLENNVAAGALAAGELIRTGCTRLAYAAHMFDYEAIQDRYLGVQKAVLQSSGIKLELIHTGGLELEDGVALGLELTSRPKDQVPDGVVCGSDALAMGLVIGLKKSNKLHIPEDISIIGCEGARHEADCPMALTRVAAPGADMGRKAMLQMLDFMKSPDVHMHGASLLNPALVLRDTTRPRPQSGGIMGKL